MSTDTKTTAAAAHTPGPWTSTHFPSSTECRHGIRANGDFFASIDAAHPRHAAEMEANARVIAAAPRMLSALIAVADGLGCQCVTGPAPRDTYRDSNGVVHKTAPCECWSCEMAREIHATIANATADL